MNSYCIANLIRAEDIHERITKGHRHVLYLPNMRNWAVHQYFCIQYAICIQGVHKGLHHKIAVNQIILIVKDNITKKKLL